MALILVVDDHSANRTFLAALLSYAGHQVHQAADGSEALAAVRQARPDLVITDVLMPTMDGYEFVRQLRVDPEVARTPVVFCTATYLEREAHALARDCGVEHVLLKPVSTSQILRTVGAVLDHTSPALADPQPADSFDRAHTRLLTDKLAAKVDELTTVADRLAALLDLSQRLAAERDPDTLLQICCDAARKISGAKYAALDVRTPDQPSFRHFHTSGIPPETLAELGQPPMSAGLFAQLLAEGQPLRVPNLGADPRAAGLSAGHPFRASFLGLPIASATCRYGMLYLAAKIGAAEFSDEDQRIATTLASQLALAYENAQRYDALQRHAAALDREIADRRQIEAQRDQLLTQEQLARASAEQAALRTARLQAVTAACSEALTLEQVTEAMIDQITLPGASSGLIALLSDDRSTLRIARAQGYPADIIAAWASIPVDAPVPLTEVIRSGEAIWLESSAAIAEHYPLLSESRMASSNLALIAIPLIAHGQVLGSIGLSFAEERVFAIEDRAIILAMSRQYAQAIYRVQTEERLWQYTQRLKTLHTLDQAILAAHSPEAIALAALRHMRELAPCRAATVSVFDLATTEAVVLAADASVSMPLQPGSRMPLDVFPALPYLQQGQPFILEDLQAMSDPTALHQLGIQDGLRSYLSVPIMSQQTLIGTLSLFSDRPRAFAPEVIDMACEVGSQLAVAIQNARLFEQVRAGAESLRLMSRQLVRAQEDERRHIARELHDEVGQSLTAALLNLQVMANQPDSDVLPARLEDSMAQIERVLQQIRTLSLNLRPAMLDDLGLAPALRWLVGRQAERSGFVATFHADVADARLASDIETTCFRAVQEAITNVVRYAQAQKVDVALFKRDADLCISIRDDGVGFDPGAALRRAAQGHSMGLLSMQERVLLLGGQMRIESAPGQGTLIEVSLPLVQPAADRPASARSNLP